MTDPSSSEPTEPPDTGTTAAEDELVSAVLDGEASADDRARVDQDPRLQARLDSFARVRESLGAAPPVTAESRESSIAAALAAAAKPEPKSGGTPPSPALLQVERSRRRRQVATIIAAAAVVLIAIPLLAIALTGRGAEQKIASTGSAADESSEALASGGAADAAPSSTTTPMGPEAASGFGVVFAGDLGAIASPGQLRAEVEGALTAAGQSLTLRNVGPQTPTTAQGRAPNADAPGAAVDACGAAISAGDPALGSLVLTATAMWSDEPALVLVYRAVVPAAAGRQTDALADVIVVARPDCTTIGRFVA